ncbi:hypothetical protein STEG23_016028 [Scotinomys teguina]
MGVESTVACSNVHFSLVSSFSGHSNAPFGRNALKYFLMCGQSGPMSIWGSTTVKNDAVVQPLSQEAASETDGNLDFIRNLCQVDAQNQPA